MKHTPLIPSLAALAITALVLGPAAPAWAAKPGGGGGKGGSGQTQPAPSPAPVPTVSGTLFATNTDAAALADHWNRSLHDLAIAGDQLYSSWGSYDDNIGPIALNSHSLTSGAQTHHLTVNGEELDALRVYGGSVYTGDVDPKVGWTSNAGFAGNAGGAWAYAAATPFIHVFDVAVAGSEIFLAGSIVNPDPAVYGKAPYLAAIKKSSDGGKTWTIAKTRSSAVGSNDFDRYYWLAVIGGKVYASATVVDQNGIRNKVLDVYSRGSWSTVTLPTSVAAGIHDAHTVVAFGTKIVGKSINNSVFVYDTAAKGKPSTQSATLGTVRGVISDFYVDGSTIYALVRASGTTTDDTLYSSKDGVSWAPVMNVDIPVPNWFHTWHNGEITSEMRGAASSVAVKDGVFYFGTNMGTLYRATR
ncbi:hypothetical protein [Microbacterium sp. Marseille-Q6648]|uniref:hypothetical protein n=1 Tax=Microbacterium sp. Marseille-Q6648 TaxID=2937991 RepID=UPI00203A6E8D|nr:hypothetical protein [Microbacterium sp. Marseille-Q6648]